MHCSAPALERLATTASATQTLDISRQYRQIQNSSASDRAQGDDLTELGGTPPHVQRRTLAATTALAYTRRYDGPRDRSDARITHNNNGNNTAAQNTPRIVFAPPYVRLDSSTSCVLS